MSIAQKRGRAWASLAVLAACVGFSTSAFAAVRVNDTWLDGTDSDPASPVYSEDGVDSDLDGNLESVWFQGGVGTLDPVAAGGPLRGNLTAGGTSSASWTTYFTPEATPVTLAQGESMVVTWKFIPTNVNASNTSQNLRVALVDSPSASRLTANGAPGSAAYTGYGMFMNMGGALGNSNPFQLRERAVASGDLLSTSGNWAALANGATSGNAGYVAGTEYTFVMELERTLLDQLQVDVTMTGGNLDNDGSATVSFLDTTPNGFTYDTFGIRPSGATTTAELFDTSLFRVEHIIPEPSSLALLGIGAASLVRRRRNS